ncbi:MAG: extracellular solute-binding protein [Clostridia bacterium]|nr:extracellular solute-binding protein [Clostridia bacterium]
MNTRFTLKHRLTSMLSLLLCACLICAGAQADNDKAFEPYAEPITLSMIYEIDVGVTFPEGDSIDDNIITRMYTEKLNIDYDLSWQVDSGSYSTQLDLAIGSDTQLPDMFMLNKRQMYELSSAGKLVDMLPYYEEYASDGLKSVLGFNDNEGIESGMIDSKLYGMPLTNDVGDGASLVFIRQDWLDELGLEVPHTLSELIEVAEAFVENNMSGRSSTMGISMARDLGFTWDVIANAYGAYPDLWLDDGNGKLVYGSVQPEIRDALLATQDLYSRGLIHKEFAAQDITRLGGYVAQGRLGILIGPFWYNNLYISSNFKVDPDAEWTVINNLCLNDGDVISSRAWNTTYRWLAVSAECPHPEAVVKTMNLWYEMWQGSMANWFWGLQMSNEYYDTDLKYYSPIFFDPPLKNCGVGVHVREAWETGNTEGLNPEELNAYTKMKEPLTPAGFKASYLTWFGSFKLLNETYNTFVYTKFRGPTDAMFAAVESGLDELEINTFVRIIMGEDISLFDDFVTQWYDEGGSYLTEKVNEWYAENS